MIQKQLQANSLESIFFWGGCFFLLGVEYFYPPSFQNLFFDICFVSTKKQIIGQCSNIAYHGNGCHFFLRQVINLCASECGFREFLLEKNGCPDFFGVKCKHGRFQRFCLRALSLSPFRNLVCIFKWDIYDYTIIIWFYPGIEFTRCVS